MRKHIIRDCYPQRVPFLEVSARLYQACPLLQDEVVRNAQDSPHPYIAIPGLVGQRIWTDLVCRMGYPAKLW